MENENRPRPNPENAPLEITRELRARGFDYTALYLEDPKIVGTLKLSDIVLRLNSPHALAEHVLKETPGDKRSCREFCAEDKTITSTNEEIDSSDVPSLTVESANRVKKLLPEEKPLSLEDAYLIALMDLHDNGPQKLSPALHLHGRAACRFFHGTYFYAPFPEGRDPKHFYKDPVELISYVIAREQETPENIIFAEQIMRRLVFFYNTELRRAYIYLNKIMKGNLKDEEKTKLASEIQLNLRGFQEISYLVDGEIPKPYPSKSFDFAFSSHLLDAWLRSYGSEEIFDPKNILNLARMWETAFGKKLSQRFRDIVTENPLDEYYNPVYMKYTLEEPL